jgi:hypothetical protein
MSSRSRSLRHGARALFVGGILASGLIFAPVGIYPLRAQEAKSKDDPSTAPTPEARLRAQRLRTRLARAAYEIARLNGEVAEIAVEEYADGIFVQDKATVDGEIKLAESDRVRSKDRLDWAKRMFEKGFVSKAQLITEELNFKKAQFALEQVQSKMAVLVKYTREKTIKELESEVKKAHNEELDKKAAWKHEEAKEADLEREVSRK